MPHISFADKKILLCLSGSIACYKVADWLRNLRRDGARVKVIMTESATRFVSPLTFAALSGHKVYTDMFAREDNEIIPHISLARDCDLAIVAPATAHTMARLAHGMADDLLATVILATDAPVIVCPAMNSKMFGHPATRANMETLIAYGYQIVSPDCGTMACGEEGPGRLAEWDKTREIMLSCLTPQDLAGQNIVITAGPTREAIDPARFLSNPSTGKMGYALAKTARMRGAEVTLISGPTSIAAPFGVKVVPVTTAEEMHRAVLAHRATASIIVKSAAVADFRAKSPSPQKLKKGNIEHFLELVPNPDILLELGELRKREHHPAVLVGFAAESEDIVNEGFKKLKKKNLDLIAVNDINRKDSGFASDTNLLVLLDRDGERIDLPLLSKEDCAHRIWDRVKKFF
ncbi:MAG: bifunctional phosphopantothenoylcysteine decarboxylase/phosphopantothenate--cysteine ligase CoaBC [Deltaproteobacteria bacterium]